MAEESSPGRSAVRLPMTCERRDDRFSSIARLKAFGYFGVPKIRALYEATYFAGLRKAGMPARHRRADEPLTVSDWEP